jgi:SM-20-related protein
MLDQILRETERNGFCLIPNLVKPDELEAINQFFETHKQEFVPAMVGALDNKQRMETIRGDFTFWLDPLNPPAQFKILLQFLDDLKLKLNENFFMGLKEFECHLAYYPAGTFYKKHSDRFESSGSRSLSFVFYLNKEWDQNAGGELVLYNKNDDILQTVKPLPGSFICFLSEEFPHEVKSGKMERRSLTGWMHTKIIY